MRATKWIVNAAVAGTLVGVVGAGAYLYQQHLRREQIAAERARHDEELRVRREQQERERTRRAVAEVQTLGSRWRDARSLAASTARIALAGPVAELQAIGRQAEAIDAPPCLVVAKGLLITGVKASTKSFLDFMSGGYAFTESQEFRKHYANFQAASGNCTAAVQISL